MGHFFGTPCTGLSDSECYHTIPLLCETNRNSTRTLRPTKLKIVVKGSIQYANNGAIRNSTISTMLKIVVTFAPLSGKSCCRGNETLRQC